MYVLMFDLGFSGCPRLLKMLDISDQQRLQKLLSDTIPLLCKRTLGYSLELSVEAFIGITLSGENASNEVVMVSFKETLLADGRVSSYVWSELPPSSGDIPPSFIEPVAFSVSESGDHQSSQTVDSVDGHGSGLQRHGEYEPNWDDDRYWAECDEAAISSGAQGASRTSISTSPLSFPVKVEENDDITKIGDEGDDFEIDRDLETTSSMGSSYESPYSSVVCRYSSERCAREIVNTRPRCLSPVNQRLPKFSKGSRKVFRHRGSTQPLSFQHLPSSLCSKPCAKMKKATVPAVNTTVQSSHSEASVSKMSV